MGRIPAAGLLIVTALAGPAVAGTSATIECRPDPAYSPGPVPVYVCREPRTGDIFDDCVRFGIVLPVLGPHTGFVCGS